MLRQKPLLPARSVGRTRGGGELGSRVRCSSTVDSLLYSLIGLRLNKGQVILLMITTPPLRANVQDMVKFCKEDASGQGTRLRQPDMFQVLL